MPYRELVLIGPTQGKNHLQFPMIVIQNVHRHLKRIINTEQEYMYEPLPKGYIRSLSWWHPNGTYRLPSNGRVLRGKVRVLALSSHLVCSIHLAFAGLSCRKGFDPKTNLPNHNIIEQSFPPSLAG